MTVIIENGFHDDHSVLNYFSLIGEIYLVIM